MVGGPPDPPDSGGSGNPMELHGNTLELTKAELRALLAHASTDEERAALCSIVVEPGRCPPRVWASDGHRAVVVVAQTRDSVGQVERTAVIVPRAPLDQALRLAGGKGRTVRLRIGPREDAPEGTTVLGAPAGIVSVEVLDGQSGAPTGAAFWAKRQDATPPDLDNALPDPDPTPGTRAPFCHLDPAALADIRHVVAAAESDPHPHAVLAGVRIYSPPEPQAQVAFTCGAWTVVVAQLGDGEKAREVRAKSPKPPPVADTLRRDDTAPAALPAKGRRRRAA